MAPNTQDWSQIERLAAAASEYKRELLLASRVERCFKGVQGRTVFMKKLAIACRLALGAVRGIAGATRSWS